jgi:Cu-processing system ATP-binding protein
MINKNTAQEKIKTDYDVNEQPNIINLYNSSEQPALQNEIISIKGLKKSFDKNPVLKGIDVSFNKGTIAAVMGPNGSGKTTLLKCVLGLVKPDAGEIIVNGINIKNNCEYRKFIGYMPQTPRFPENLKVKELIEMLKDVNEWFSDYDEELLNRLNMPVIYNKLIGTLSAGTKQRVNCAISFLFNQKIIILDEPTAGLDPVSCDIVKEKIIKEKENGKLIIITSHIVSEVEALADRIVFLLEGNVHVNSTVNELKDRTNESNLNKAVAKIMTDYGS